ncbi:MAG: class I SAM-dependent methyltransferase [Sphingomonadales bacterium]
MHVEVTRLRDFYHTPLGRVTARLVGQRLATLWPDLRAMNVLGLGYAVPYLGALGHNALGQKNTRPTRIINLMAASQGVHAWTPGGGANETRGGNLAGIAEDAALPLADATMDRILMVHMFETSDRPRALLREVWRVLAPGGRLIVIVPNRIGVWSLLEHTPFGHGRPYSRGQFAATLTDHMFTPVTHTTALHAPPFTGRAGVRLLGALDRTGGKFWPGLGGVHIMEAEKRVYAGDTRAGVRVVKPRPIASVG